MSGEFLQYAPARSDGLQRRAAMAAGPLYPYS
jgi:hypothetical protein